MEDLLAGSLDATPQAEQVLMSLDAQWLELMFTGEKAHEFRKRFPLDVATEWYVYLTAPTSPRSLTWIRPSRARPRRSARLPS